MSKNLYYKIFWVSLLPIILISIVNFLQIEYFTQKEVKEIRNTNHLQKEIITNRLRDTISLIKRDINILCNSYEVLEALKYNDNDLLTIWGKNFLTKDDIVIFTDINGIVIARAHDEYNFGDSLEKSYIFEKLVNNDNYTTIDEIDGIYSLIVAKKVKQYNEITIGYIIIAKRLNSNFIDSITKGTNFTLNVSKDGTNALVLRDITDSREKLFFKFLENNQIENLNNIKNNILISTIILILFLILALYFVIKKHLIPYTQFGLIVSDFIEDRISLLELTKKSKRFLRKNQFHEVYSISNTIYLMAKQIYKNQSKLEKLSQTDSLTDILNRRRLDTLLLNMANQANRYKTTFSIIIIDIDFFKVINDTHGHLIGDEILKSLCKDISSNIRNTDYFGRFGGEEFLLICPNTNLDEARVLAEKLRISIMNKTFINKIKLTISLGISQYLDNTSSIKELIDIADKNLYEAKHSGRNKVIG